MKRFASLSVALALAVYCVAQQPAPTPKIDPDSKENMAKWKRIPMGWKALKLTDKQKEEIYKAKREYFIKITDLEMQLEKARMDEKQALAKVLTEAQKKALIGASD